MSVRAAPDVGRRQVPAAVAAVVASGMVTVAAGPIPGAVCDAAVVLALLNMHLLTHQDSGSLALFPVLALTPLVRLIGFAIPVAGVSPVVRDALVATPLLLALWLFSRAIPLHPPALRPRPRDLPQQVVIAVCGIPLGIVAYEIPHPRPLAHPGDPGAIVFAVLVLGCLVAPALELLFRWALHDQLLALLPGAGPVLINLMFMSLYLGTSSASFVALMGFTGLGLSLAVRRSRIVSGAIVAHALLAIGLLVVWPSVLP
jgi:hypothetical protein